MPQRMFERAVIELLHTYGLFMRRVRTASASNDLSLTESAVLGRLAMEGPATTADLARAESMKPQSMGTTVATLEELGLVQRMPHPTDGRQVLITLSAGGAVAQSSAMQTWLMQAIKQLDKQEQETLFSASAIIKRLVKL